MIRKVSASFFFLSLLSLFFLNNACRSPKDGMTRKERKAWQIARAQELRDSIVQDSLDRIARLQAIEQARLDSIRIADSIAALPPPIDYDTVLLASLQRLPCYGKCPHYEIRLYASGYATYEGKAYTPRFGKYEARLDSAKVITAWQQKVAEVDYFNFEIQYPIGSRGIKDFPLTVTSVRKNNQKKVIYNRNDAPAKLVEYEKFFDQLFEEASWKALEQKPNRGLVPKE